MMSLFVQAAQAYRQIAAQCAELDLHEELLAARREFNKRFRDRSWSYNKNNNLDRYCRSFAAELEHDDGYTAMQIALDDYWPVVAAKEIIAYAERFSPKPAMPKIKPRKELVL